MIAPTNGLLAKRRRVSNFPEGLASNADLLSGGDIGSESDRAIKPYGSLVVFQDPQGH